MKPSATRCYTPDFFSIYNVKESLDKQSGNDACKVVFNVLMKIFNNKNLPIEPQFSAVKTYMH